MHKLSLIALGCLLMVTGTPAVAPADIFQWRDGSGRPAFTDHMETIPTEKRSQARKVRPLPQIRPAEHRLPRSAWANRGGTGHKAQTFSSSRQQVKRSSDHTDFEVPGQPHGQLTSHRHFNPGPFGTGFFPGPFLVAPTPFGGNLSPSPLRGGNQNFPAPVIQFPFGGGFHNQTSNIQRGPVAVMPPPRSPPPPRAAAGGGRR